MISFKQNNLNPNSLGGTNLETIFADDKGIIWIGYGDKGLDKFDPATGIFKHYRHISNDSGSLSNNSVSAILKDSQGTGTYFRLVYYTPKNFALLSTLSY